jgi:rod shape-determining protein MreC
LLEAQVVELQEYKYENEILKQELQILDTNTQDELVASKIISKEISPFLQNVILDKGEKDGIREGQAILSQGYLVGIIAQVYDDYSQAEMINGSKTMIPVLLQDSRATGILTSHLDGLFIENIPIDNELRHGEVVLTSNLSQNIPENVLVGKVDKIVKYDSQIFQTIKVITPIDFSKLEFVFIVKR